MYINDPPPGPTREAGILSGWMVKKINGRKITSNSEVYQDAKRKAVNDAEHIVIFGKPKYLHIKFQSFEDMTLGDLELELGMDFLELSDKAQQKLKNEL